MVRARTSLTFGTLAGALTLSMLATASCSKPAPDPEPIRFKASVAINDGISEKDRGKVLAAVTDLEGIRDALKENPQYWYFLARAYGFLNMGSEAVNAVENMVANGWTYDLGDTIEKDGELYGVAARYPDEIAALNERLKANVQAWGERQKHAHQDLDPTTMKRFKSFAALQTTYETRRNEEGAEYKALKLKGRRAITEWRWHLLDEERATIQRYLAEHPSVGDREAAYLRLVMASAEYHGDDNSLDFWNDDAAPVLAAADAFLAEFPTSTHAAAVALTRATAAWYAREKPADEKTSFTEEALTRGLDGFRTVAAEYPGTTEAGIARVWQIALLSAKGSPGAAISDDIKSVWSLLGAQPKDNADLQAQIAKRISRVGFVLGGLPSFTLTDTHGNTYTGESLKGNVVLLDFWATWCPPCVEGLPKIKEAYEAHRDKGFVVVGIASEEDDMTDDAFKAWGEKKGISWPEIKLTYGNDDGEAIWNQFGVKSIPHYILVGRNGEVIEIRTGWGLEDLLKKVPALLAESKKS